jgi:hypothetical protein
MESSAPDARETQPPARAAPRSRHRFKAWRRRVGRALAHTLAPHVVRALTATWRIEVEGAEHVAAARARGGYFMALWHGSMLVPAVRHGHQGYCVLVSPSGDGDVSEALLTRFGYGVVRGSTSKRSRAALRELLARLEAGTPIVITPDGPRGPRRTMSDGLAWMARLTGAPVIPCGFVARGAWRLSSWDRFAIPKPLARVAFVYEPPIHVERGDDGGIIAASARIGAALVRAERRACALAGAEYDG